MATRVRRRRGTKTEHSAFTGAEGEFTYDTTWKTIRTHDGTTGGWEPLARLTDLPINIKLYGAVGDGTTDDTAAIQAAMDAHRRIFVPPDLTFMAAGLSIVAATACREIVGVPGKSVIKSYAGTGVILGVNAADEGTTDPADNVAGVWLYGIEFRGRSEMLFSQFVHNVILSAVSNARVERCKFTSFRGDGLYLGCYTADTERHNENVVIRECVFDGVNKQSRNALTITDVTQLLVEDCYFTRCTKVGMPGAIDIEPDAAAYIRLRDIYIQRNRFHDIGVAANSNVAINFALVNGAVNVTQADLTTPVNNIVIRDNRFSAVDKGVAFTQSWNASSGPVNLLVENNVIAVNAEVTTAPLKFSGLRGLIIRGNRMTYSPNAVAFSGTVIDLEYDGNQHKQCEISSETLSNANFVNNTFNTCGNTGKVFSFSSGYTSANITIARNVVSGAGWTHVVEGTGHTFGSDNQFFQNVGVSALTNEFKWVFGDTIRGGDGTSGTTALAVKDVTGATDVLTVRGDGAVKLGSSDYVVSVKTQSATWNPGSLLDGAATDTTIATFAGLDPAKDVCVVNFSTLTYAGWFLFAHILDSVTVHVSLMNKTGGTVDLPSGTLRVTVIKHP